MILTKLLKIFTKHLVVTKSLKKKKIPGFLNMQGCSICAFKLNYLYFCDYSGSLDIILALYGIIRSCT